MKMNKTLKTAKRRWCTAGIENRWAPQSWTDRENLKSNDTLPGLFIWLFILGELLKRPYEAPHPLSFYKLRCDRNRDRSAVGARLGELPCMYASTQSKEQAAFSAPEGSAGLLSVNHPLQGLPLLLLELHLHGKQPVLLCAWLCHPALRLWDQCMLSSVAAVWGVRVWFWVGAANLSPNLWIYGNLTILPSVGGALWLSAVWGHRYAPFFKRHFKAGGIKPLCLCERPPFVSVFANGKKPEKDVSFYETRLQAKTALSTCSAAVIKGRTSRDRNPTRRRLPPHQAPRLWTVSASICASSPFVRCIPACTLC